VCIKLNGIWPFGGPAIFARFAAKGRSHIAQGVPTRHYRGWQAAESNTSNRASWRTDCLKMPISGPIDCRTVFSGLRVLTPHIRVGLDALLSEEHDK
jgi:hypothetical protein